MDYNKLKQKLKGSSTHSDVAGDTSNGAAAPECLYVGLTKDNCLEKWLIKLSI